MKKDDPNNRFDIVSEESMCYGAWKIVVFRDKATKVLYVQTMHGTQLGGLTPLLDKEGKPITDLDGCTS